MLKKIIKTLEDHKAQDIISINLEGKSSMSDYMIIASGTSQNLEGKSSMSDYMIIASGTSQRHLQSLGKYVEDTAVKAGVKTITREGSDESDWVLIDLNSIIVHLFRPEMRSLYDLEGMWADAHPLRQQG